MGRQRPPFDEQFKELDPYQQDAVAAMMERYGHRFPAGPSPAELEAQAAAKRNTIGAKMKRFMWRGMENLSRYGQGAAWLPLELAKLPGTIEEAVSGSEKPGFFGKIKQSAENVGRELRAGTDFFQEKAGVPKEEHWYPTAERFIPKWVPETAGTFTQPGPALPTIRKLMSKEAIKPAAQGAAEMGTYSAGVSGLEQFNRKPEERDWWQVPEHAAEGAVMAPFIQRMMGAFERRGIRPIKENALPPGRDQVLLPQQPQPARPPMPESAQITDFVDVPFEEIHSAGEIPHIPTKPLAYQPPQSPPIMAPGPVATGPGTSIALPGPVYTRPPIVEDMIAKGRPSSMRPTDMLPDELAVNPVPQDPFLVKKPPVMEAQTPVLQDTSIDALAGQNRPGLVKAPDMIPDALAVNTARREPFLSKRTEDPSRLYERDIPGVRTLENPANMTPKVVAQKPRHELPPDLNEDLLNRVAYARDTLQIAGDERGFQTMGEGGSSKSPTFPWYKKVTIDGGMKPKDVETALAKIERDQGADKGRYVERVKEAILTDPEFQGWQRSYGGRDPMLQAEAEYNVVPDEPIHPSDFPEDVLPPLEDTFQDPTVPPGVGAGGDFNLEVKNPHDLGLQTPTGQLAIDVPPPTIGERPLIGREVAPEDDAPLFNLSQREPAPEQVDIFAGGPEPTSPAGHESAAEIRQEIETDQALFTQLKNVLNDERGSVKLGGGVGPIERLLTQRRFAEKHPQDFGPIYKMALDRFEWVAAQKHDLHTLGKPYFLLEQADRKILDETLRKRRRLGEQLLNTKPPFIKAVLADPNDPQHATVVANLRAQVDTQLRKNLPATLRPGFDSVIRMMDSANALTNDVRATKGHGAMPFDPFFVPFARSGDYLTIATLPNQAKWVSAATTLREAEARADKLKAQYPGVNVLVKTTASRKGDLPALDFGTLARLEKAGFIDRTEFEQIVQQFDLPPGFSAHFRHAQKILGESVDLLDPIERYVDGLTNYGARFLYDDPMKGLIDGVKDPAIRQYAEQYREYLNTKPQEYSRLRGGVAVWDLSLNIGSMIQNATQVPLVGFPVIEQQVGKVKAAQIFNDARKALLHPAAADKRILEMAEREGHIRPINAEELFGARGVSQQELELGSPYVQRQIEKGWLPPSIGKAIRKPLDMTAGGIESALSKGGDLNLAIGQKLSYALHRLGAPAPIAAQKAQAAHPVLMQGFASIEEQNRKLGILLGYRTGEAKGMPPDEAYEYAKKISRDINYDYSPASRAQAFRGLGAPLGLFMTFQTEYMATVSKLIRAQLKSPGFQKLTGPGTTAIAAFWTIGGLKGLPGVEDFDLYGPDPGMLSQNLPDWAWSGPISAATGFDAAAKFKVGPRIPYDMLHGSLDASQVPVAQPFVNIAQGTGWFMDSPMDAPSTQKYAERLLPPAARNLATAGRWAGFGPAGEIEDGSVGTIRGHTPGPTEEGKRDFFHPDAIDIAGKAATFTPLELSKQYTRGRIQQRLRDMDHSRTTQLVNAAAHSLDRNGPNVPSPALEELRKAHPKTYAELIHANNRRRSGAERGSTEEIYRKAQEPKVIKR